jgi:hypothetical protein
MLTPLRTCPGNWQAIIKDASGLHRHMGDAEAREPVAQAEQVAGHRPELGAQLRALARLVRHVHAGRHPLLVNNKKSSVGSPRAQRFCFTCARRQFGVPRTPRPFSRRTRSARTPAASTRTTTRVSLISCVVGDAARRHELSRDIARPVSRAHDGGGLPAPSGDRRSPGFLVEAPSREGAGRGATVGADARAATFPRRSDGECCAPPGLGWPRPRRPGGVRRERPGAGRRRGRDPRMHARR